MTKILITGFSGFVSRHFLEYLDRIGVEAEILGVARSAPQFPLDQFRHLRCSFRQLDMLDKSGVDEVIHGFQPAYILHLAAYSSVGFSWQRPVESFNNNTNVLLNLLEQVRALKFPCRILSVGSSEEYGNVRPEMLPLSEDERLRPLSPYAVARVAQEMLSSVYVKGYGLDVVMTRSFNHIGVYQRELFVVPSLAKQLTSIKKGKVPARLVTGERSIVRDFVDVRDVVRAYHDLLLGGTPGEIYNVCTGQGTSIDRVIATMQEILGTDAALETDPRLVRPDEIRTVVGSNEKLRAAVGWQPRISLHESLTGILTWWQERV